MIPFFLPAYASARASRCAPVQVESVASWPHPIVFICAAGAPVKGLALLRTFLGARPSIMFLSRQIRLSQKMFVVSVQMNKTIHARSVSLTLIGLILDSRRAILPLGYVYDVNITED